MSRIDPRLSRRAFVFVGLNLRKSEDAVALSGPGGDTRVAGTLVSRLKRVAVRFTSIAGTELEFLFRWCSFTGPRFAGAS